ncbi:MAG: hypothetical protein ACPGPF_01875 [Pontibacterium sp.]
MKKRILTIIALLAVAFIGWLVWLSQTDWLLQYNLENNARYESLKQEGLTFGATADQQACLNQALNKVDGCLDFHCKVAAGKYLKACWSLAEPAADLCTDVPTFNEKPSEDEKAWSKDQCAISNIIGDGCPLIMRQTQVFCATIQGERQ